MCLGLEPGAAVWKLQTNPLSYGGNPNYLRCYNIVNLLFSCFITFSVRVVVMYSTSVCLSIGWKAPSLTYQNTVAQSKVISSFSPLGSGCGSVGRTVASDPEIRGSNPVIGKIYIQNLY